MLLIPFILVAYVLLYAFAFTVPLDFVQQPLTDALSTGKLSSAPSLDTWLKKEEAVAVDRLLANVAPGGRNAQDATPGTVIASPSREHPDYYFQ
ncbi:hypothetical protein LTR04_004880, partial [Oleoguttula sp. CCFEE 6159]